MLEIVIGVYKNIVNFTTSTLSLLQNIVISIFNYEKKELLEIILAISIKKEKERLKENVFSVKTVYQQYIINYACMYHSSTKCIPFFKIDCSLDPRHVGL